MALASPLPLDPSFQDLDRTLRLLVDNHGGGIAVFARRRHRSGRRWRRVERDRHDPEQALMGLQLAPSADAVIVVASSVVTSGGGPKSSRSHDDGVLAHGVTRAGRSATRLRVGQKSCRAASPPQGWVVDACRRSLALPTMPHSGPSTDVVIAGWLDRLLTRIIDDDGGSPLSWPEAVELCLLGRAVPGQRGTGTAPALLAELITASRRSWSTMRMAAAAAGPGGPLPPEWAGWMDDAMFARWVLGWFPDIASLRADVELLASPEIADRVAATLEAIPDR